MASINYRLQRISSNLFIKHNSTERVYIDGRISILTSNLKSYFGNSISDVKIFGSYKRDTILPRKFDENSDIDILVIFNQAEKELTPETYRNQLKKFALYKYSTSSILKDHPSIILEMNKIKFDLVPCRIYQSFFTNTYQIPSRTEKWMDTYPTDFNTTLTNANTKYNSIVKPLIRLFKRWNAYNNFPFASFDLEQRIANMNFSNDNYETGFLYVINQLTTYGLTIYQAKKVETLKTNGTWIKTYIDRNDQTKAIEVTCRILGILV